MLSGFGPGSWHAYVYASTNFLTHTRYITTRALTQSEFDDEFLWVHDQIDCGLLDGVVPLQYTDRET